MPTPATEVGFANWDLTAFFTSLTEDRFTAWFHDVERRVTSLKDRARVLGPLEPARLPAWRELLVDLEEASARMGHLVTYVCCRRSEDTADEEAGQAGARLDLLQAAFRQVEVPLEASLKVASQADFAALLEEPALQSASWFLQRMRQRARFTMEASLESLAADLEVTGFQSWERLYETLAGQLEFEIPGPEGTSRRFPMSLKVSMLEDPDPEVRRAVLEGSNRAWSQVGDVAAACLNCVAGHRLTLQARRGIRHFLDEAAFDSVLERRTLDSLLEAIRSRWEVPRRYLHCKARLLGGETLGFEDLSAPLPLPEPERVSWQAGCARILQAFSGFDPEMADFAQMALEQGWVESEPRPGKAPGGFCISSIPLRQSRIFMTFQGQMGDVSTLAHELGHAWHEWVVRDLRPWMRDYPMTLAETASTFAEQVLADSLLEDPSADERNQLILLDRRLEQAATYLLNIPMRFLFEVRLYEERARGELTVSRLKELMTQAQSEVYGGVLDPARLDPWFWASKGHFYFTSTSFYNFPYAFGYLFSLGVYARARREGPAFLPRYRDLLRRTGGDSCEGVARQALGVDLGEPDFWLESLDLVQRDLERFEKLLPRVFASP
jgi:oligoendopeptidase F